MIDEIVVDAPQPNFQPMKTGTLPFDLIIKNGLKKYEVHGIIMSSISKKIYKILSDDPKKKLIELDYPDRIDILSQVIDFCYGFNFTINSSNFEVTYLISADLEIPYLQNPSQEILEKSFTIQNVVTSLHFIHDAKGDIRPHITFIQQNFDEMMYQDAVKALPFEILDTILSSDELKVKDENSLAYWVSDVIKERGDSCVKLVDRLCLAYISDQAQLELCDRKEIDAHSFITSVRRAKQSQDPPSRRYLVKEQDIEKLIQTDNELKIQNPKDKSVEGIINYILSNQKKGIPEIRLTVSSTHDRYFLPKNLLELKNEHSVWYSEEWPKEQWIMYDFSPRMLNISAYTLRTSGGNKGSGHLKSWKIIGSNDQKKWILIDERKGVIDLNSNYAAVTFECTSPSFFRFIKIEQTDKNHHDDYSFILSCCEFFGRAVPKNIE
ncbi:Kelch-like protein 20 [Tritrichomonas musculus]|uniref:Kelch-like protein 20 n=1 Tax=Tritrichomonas musculus TaxID=1915356 RepID=A0ABR2KV88_9EUKA